MNLADEMRFSDFAAKVRSLWTSWRVSDEELHSAVWGWMRHQSDETIGEVLTRHRRSDPDARKAVWKIVRQSLPKRTDGDGLNIWLNAQRNRMREMGYEDEATNHTPLEIVQGFVRANMLPVTHRQVLGRPTIVEKRHGFGWEPRTEMRQRCREACTCAPSDTDHMDRIVARNRDELWHMVAGECELELNELERRLGVESPLYA